MKKYRVLAHREGQTAEQAHVGLPTGSYEREIGREGFFGAATHMYHRHPPTAWLNFEGPIRPRAFDASQLLQPQASPMDAATLLSNAHTQYRYWQSTASMDHLFRNADGDDLMFVHEGAAEFYCDFGHLSLRAGDYLVIPRGTMWRLEHAQPVSALLIEATNNAYRLPDRGLLGPHALFDPAVLDVPEMDQAFLDQQTEDEWSVVIKRHNQASTVRFGFNPLDAIGWQGDNTPLRLNWRDIRPVMSHRYHLPPSAHTTFVADRFVVCTFVPRPLETDADAIKVPFFHSNDDFDEVIFYHAGEFFSRDNIHPGMISFHPAGFTHGPHPKALDNILAPTEATTNEVAVMLDARDALNVGEAATAIERVDYVDSWRPMAASEQ